MFVARAERDGQVEEVCAPSSAFRWRRSSPPDTQESRVAHSELVGRLEDEGWTKRLDGEPWYAAEFTRPLPVSALVEPERTVRYEPVVEVEPAPRVEEPQPAYLATVLPPNPVAEPVPRPAPPRPVTVVPAEEPVDESEPSRRRRRDWWRYVAGAGLAAAVALLVRVFTHGS
jgi:hypothetical protein